MVTQRPEQRVGILLCHLFCIVNQRCRRGICLKAVRSAAGAPASLCAALDMAKLRAAGMSALKDFTVYYNTAADTSAKCQKNCILAALCRAAQHFSKRCAVRVILYINGDWKIFLQFLCKRDIVPADIVGIEHDAILAVNGSRAADACACAVCHVKAVLGKQRQRSLSHVCNHFLIRAAGVRRDRRLRQYFIGCIQNPNFYCGSAKVNTDRHLFTCL